jgi:hypothetical protein
MTAQQTERDTKLDAIDAAYTTFETTGDLHELARAVGTVLDRRDQH